MLKGGTLRIHMCAKDVTWVQDCRDGMSIPMSITSSSPPMTNRCARKTEGMELDGEQRVDVVRERMFGKLSVVGRKYFGVESRLRFNWNGKCGGSAWAEMCV